MFVLQTMSSPKARTPNIIKKFSASTFLYLARHAIAMDVRIDASAEAIAYSNRCARVRERRNRGFDGGSNISFIVSTTASMGQNGNTFKWPPERLPPPCIFMYERFMQWFRAQNIPMRMRIYLLILFTAHSKYERRPGHPKPFRRLVRLYRRGLVIVG